MGRARLVLAAAAVAAAALWLGVWLLAAASLAIVIRFGRRDRTDLLADVVVFLGLAGQADPLWVALLILATVAARAPDPRARAVVLLAALAAVFIYVDWTILTGLLAVIAMFRAAAALRRSLQPATHQR